MCPPSIAFWEINSGWYATGALEIDIGVADEANVDPPRGWIAERAPGDVSGGGARPGIAEATHEVVGERPAGVCGAAGGRPVPVRQGQVWITADLLEVILQLEQEFPVPRSERWAAMGTITDCVVHPHVVVIPIRDATATGRGPRRILQIQECLDELRLLDEGELGYAVSALHDHLPLESCGLLRSDEADETSCRRPATGRRHWR
jgi:hypothetical protein